MQEVDADKEYRANMNLFRKKAAARASYKIKAAAAEAADARVAAAGPVEETPDDDETQNHFAELDDEEVALEELLEDLELESGVGSGAGPGAVKPVNEEDVAITIDSTVVLTAEEAARVPAMDVGGGEFGTNSHVASNYKFV